MTSAMDKLVLLSGDPSSTSATVVVGGIHDTFKHFESWEGSLAAPDRAVYGFDHNHQSMTMAEAATLLADGLRGLSDRGTSSVEVIAHSMGGLVSKAGLNELASSGDAGKFDNIELHALGTPWGGFALAALPGASLFGPAVGYPMAGEMSPGSEFMEKLSSNEWPSNMSMSVYQGTADTVSTPSTPFTQERYDANVAGANAYVTVQGADHVGYVKVGPEVLQEGNGRELEHFEVAKESSQTGTGGSIAQTEQEAPKVDFDAFMSKLQAESDAEAAGTSNIVASDGTAWTTGSGGEVQSASYSPSPDTAGFESLVADIQGRPDTVAPDTAGFESLMADIQSRPDSVEPATGNSYVQASATPDDPDDA